MFAIGELAVGAALLFAQPAQVLSIALDPTSPHATDVHWTITLSAPYCGGFRIGDGVYVQPEPPLALPADVPADAVLFDGQPADVSLQAGVLRIAPSHAVAQSMVCQAGTRQFTVELLGSLGLTNPDAGNYTVDVWLGSAASGTPQQLPVTIDAPMPASAPSTGCGPIRQKVDAASAALQADNAALAKTFDAIRAQSPQLAAQAPGLAAAQGDLVRQLDGVQASSQAMASDGWNPNIAYAAQAIDWAQASAPADLTVLRNPAVQPEDAPPSSVAAVIALVQLAQQQAQDANAASQRLFDVVQQLGDCGLGGSAPVAGAQSAHGNITTWSVQVNTPDWNKNLGVTGARQGCSSAPPECVKLVGKVAQTSHVRATLVVPLNATTTTTDATRYSQLSLSAPFLVEVGIDDFVDQYTALFKNGSSQPATIVDTVIANLKSANPALKFGATIYDDQFKSAYLQDARLPAAVRARFDYVHLFVHFRQDGLNFEQSVQQAKQMFPNAVIIAGSYAYDRRAYLPCARGGTPCTSQQDLDLFSQTFAIQAQLLASKTVESIEFYPGYFGAEEKWTGWTNPRECAPGDLANCIANTKTMRQAALTILGSGSPPINVGPGR